jgi:hypothetical protein
MKFSTRELVLLAAFGALWGVVEITLGSVLKSLDVPLSGMLLSGVGLLVALIARLFVPRRGATLFVGIIAMLLKLFSLGGVIIGPMMAIFAEALLAELILSGLGPSRPSFVIAGALGTSWSLIQPFITGPMLMGHSFLEMWQAVINKAARILHLPQQSLWLIILLFVGLHLLGGGVAGWLAWPLGHHLQRRSQQQEAR